MIEIRVTGDRSLRKEERMRLNAVILPILAIAVLGCGSSADGSGDAVKNGQDPGDPPSGWQTLISGEWTMPAGAEGYVCVRKTVKEDLFVSSFDTGSSSAANVTEAG